MPNEAFFIEIQNFWTWADKWADKFWGIWGIFCQTISTHFGTVSPSSSMFFIIQPLFLHKTQPLLSTSQIFICDWDLNLNLNRKELAFVCP